MLKLLFLLLPCKEPELSLWTLWLVQIVLHQSPKNHFTFSGDYVNHLVSQFELKIHVFEHCWNQHCGKVFVSTKVFCCNDQLTLQSSELFEICHSRCKIFDQTKVSVFDFPAHFEINIHVVGVLFGPRKVSVLKFPKIHIIGKR